MERKHKHTIEMSINMGLQRWGSQNLISWLPGKNNKVISKVIKMSYFRVWKLMHLRKSKDIGYYLKLGYGIVQIACIIYIILEGLAQNKLKVRKLLRKLVNSENFRFILTQKYTSPLYLHLHEVVAMKGNRLIANGDG